MNLELLIEKEKIEQRLQELGQEISSYYGKEPVTMLIVLNGAMIFACDLMRQMQGVDLFIDTISVSSYSNNQSTGKINFRSVNKLPFTNRHVLIVDDILDTGLTFAKIKEYCTSQDALSVKTCVLLSKRVERANNLSADWCAFEVDDKYVIGYGFDSNESFRHLPDIMVNSEE